MIQIIVYLCNQIKDIHTTLERFHENGAMMPVWVVKERHNSHKSIGRDSNRELSDYNLSIRETIIVKYVLINLVLWKKGF